MDKSTTTKKSEVSTNSEVPQFIFGMHFYSVSEGREGGGRWGSSISVVSDYRLDDEGLIPGRGKGFFL
jgi:hypothetical protein